MTPDRNCACPDRPPLVPEDGGSRRRSGHRRAMRGRGRAGPGAGDHPPLRQPLPAGPLGVPDRHRFGELVASKTGGKVKVDMFHNASLGSEREAAEGVKSGSIDMAYSGLGGFGSYVREFGVLEMPYLYDSLDEVKSVVDKISPQLEARMAADGLALLGYLFDGPRVTLSTRPLNSIDDFKGLKFRVPQSPLYVQMAQAFGATPDPGGAAGGLHGAPVEDRRGAGGHADLAVHAEVPRGGQEHRPHRPHLLRRLYRHERAAAGQAVAADQQKAIRDAGREASAYNLRDRQAGRAGGLRPAGGGRRQGHRRPTGPRSAPRSADMREKYAAGLGDRGPGDLQRGQGRDQGDPAAAGRSRRATGAPPLV